MKKNKYKIIIFTAITLIIAVRAFAEPYLCLGDCMEPAIMTGNHYFLNRISPYVRKYQVGDIIAFRHEDKVWVSRVVALENNTIQITEGNIVVNGNALHDAETRRSCSNWKHGIYAIDKPLQILPDHVFVLSDNLSAQHDDSRTFGPISKEAILGVIW